MQESSVALSPLPVVKSLEISKLLKFSPSSLKLEFQQN